MKKDYFVISKSSYLGMAKDTSLIIDKILNNNNLLKLLYYTDEDCLNKPNLTSVQKKELFDEKIISNIPKVMIDKEKKNFLRITYDSFTPNVENPYYRDHIVELKIICPFDCYDLGDFDLRPYRIAGELDSMLNEQH